MSQAALLDQATPAAKVVPVRRGYPIIGCALDVLRNAPEFMSELAREHPGEIVSVRLGPATFYLVTHPDHVRHVLQDRWRDFSKGEMWKQAEIVLGKGLATSGGELWLRQRRMIQPLFSAAHIASLADTMIDTVEGEMARLGEIAEGTVVDMATQMAMFTQRLLLATMCGTSVDRGTSEHLAEQLQIAAQQVNLRMFLYFLPEGFPLPGTRALEKAVKEVDLAMLRIVRERRASGGGDREDLLSLLLAARDEGSGETMDDRQLRDELVTFFGAGNETTATSLTWLWYLLDKNPAVMARLRAEVTEVLGDRKPTQADLQRLTYAKMVWQEALRMYPSGWMLPRFADKDSVIGGYLVPAGAPVLVSPLITQRDPAFWPDPEVFDPERFTPERSAGRPRYAYYPFGGGPRKCIGDTLALMQGQLIVAMMVQRFCPRLVPGTKVVAQSTVTLTPRHGMKMTLERVSPAAGSEG